MNNITQYNSDSVISNINSKLNLLENLIKRHKINRLSVINNLRHEKSLRGFRQSLDLMLFLNNRIKANSLRKVELKSDLSKITAFKDTTKNFLPDDIVASIGRLYITLR